MVQLRLAEQHEVTSGDDSAWDDLWESHDIQENELAKVLDLKVSYSRSWVSLVRSMPELLASALLHKISWHLEVEVAKR